MRRIDILIAFCLWISACNSPRNKSTDDTGYINSQTVRIRVPEDAYHKVSHLHTVIDSITFIPLETKDQCLIAENFHYKIHDSLVFITDKEQRLLVFDRQGKFKYQIGNRGSGPGEYNWIYNFLINDTNEIEILDVTHIHLFSIQGEYKYTRSFNYEEKKDYYIHPHSFAHAPDGGYYLWNHTSYYFDYENNPRQYLMYRVNHNFEILDSIFPVEKRIGSDFYRFSYYDNNLIISPFGDNYNIYQIDKKGNISSRYLYEFGKYDNPHKKGNLQKIENPAERITTVEEKYVRGLWMFNENKNWTYTSISLSGKRYHLFYNKKTKTPYLTNGIIPYLQSDEMGFWGAEQIVDNQLVSMIELSWVQAQLDRLSPEYAKKIGLDKLADLEETDNPVLVFYHLKEF